MKRVLIKICGLRHLASARAALAAGADYLGFVLAPSRRRVSPEAVRTIVRQLPEGARTVGVFVDESAETINEMVAWCGLTHVQLSGDEAPALAAAIRAPVLKALRLGGPGHPAAVEPGDYAGHVAAFVLDRFQAGTFGGTGQTCDWQLAAYLAARYPCFLAGGLNPENVGAAIAAVRPLGVDVSSGVEVVGLPGQKDVGRIEAFIAAVRRAEK